MLNVKYQKIVFNTEMDFRSFPYDHQQLKMMIRTQWDQMSTSFVIDSVNIESRKVPGWSVQSLSVVDGFERLNDTFQMSETHPLAAVMDDPNNMYRSATLTITVSRESRFYVTNMITPIWLLTVLSWSTFVVDPSSIDVRMSMVLTIMLGFIAFQFVVNDNMPKSGESSRLHEFMNLANWFIAVVGVESVLVYKMAAEDLGVLVSCMRCRKHKKTNKVDNLKDRSSKHESAVDVDANTVGFDGESSEKELALIAQIDQFFLVVTPTSFAALVYFKIFKDSFSLKWFCAIVSLELLGLCCGATVQRVRSDRKKK